jgi:cytochrome P450
MLEHPFEFYDHVRRTEPVYEVPERDLFIITKREDIEFVLMNRDLFTVKGRSPTKTYPQRYPTRLDLSNVDPPEHRALRRAYMLLLAPRRIAQLREQMEAKAHQLIDAFASEPEIELISVYARPLPAWFMGALLGVPEDMHLQLAQWANDYFELMDSNLHRTRDFDVVEKAHQRSYVDFMNFCGDLVTEWRRNPPQGALGDFVNSLNSAGKLYTIDELANQLRLLISGAQTTIEAIAQAVDAVRLNDRQALDDDETLQLLVEESIRKDGPATYTPRRPLQDIELSGVKIPAGKRILLSLQAGNHDDAFYSSPDEFDLNRSKLRRHIGFGLGIHFCVGAPTARAETFVAVRALFARFRDIRLSDRNDYAHRTDLTAMRVLKQVHLELEAVQ